MLKEQPIEQLRRLCETATSFYERTTAYLHMLYHPELEWGDLLKALKQPGLVREQAAICLTIKLLKTRPEQLNYDEQYWRAELHKQNIDAASKCGPCGRKTGANEIIDIYGA